MAEMPAPAGFEGLMAALDSPMCIVTARRGEELVRLHESGGWPVARYRIGRP